MSSIQKIAKYLRIISIGLFGVALFLPTYCTNVQCAGFGAGFEALASGWILAFFYGGAAFAWFANPIYITTFFVARKEPLVGIGFTAIAIFIAQTFLDGGELLLNEAGHTAYITKIEIGYWFWLGSMVVLLFYSIVNLVVKIKTKGAVKQEL
ncbi:hypothetical protein [Fluviicola sp.]|uniref:hypothetical protein n=1 Tax=Fluviicola sp. TaxID=1917219 RepID=UPI0026217ABF|nr:hypothetical protein [Fluviicola sp.]